MKEALDVGGKKRVYERIIENRIVNGVETFFMNSRHIENLAEV